jgi:hypothetical protein
MKHIFFTQLFLVHQCFVIHTPPPPQDEMNDEIVSIGRHQFLAGCSKSKGKAKPSPFIWVADFFAWGATQATEAVDNTILPTHIWHCITSILHNMAFDYRNDSSHSTPLEPSQSQSGFCPHCPPVPAVPGTHEIFFKNGP